jgi:polyhydroxyalkanoate synthesis regulator protein
MPAALAPTTIRRCANRRLYNRKAGAYISLDQLGLVADGDEKFIVREASSDETPLLKQITVQRGNHG